MPDAATRAFAAGREVADALLYEGYVLYPYRASAPKNTNELRWQFGVLVPPAYDGEPSSQRTECVIEMGSELSVHVRVRFLQLQARTDPGRPAWDEAVERAIDMTVKGAALTTVPFAFEGGSADEGEVRREWWDVCGQVTVGLESLRTEVPAGKLTVLVENTSSWSAPAARRHDAVRRSLVATHILAAVDGGAFVSSLEPPAWAEDAVAACDNDGTFPVLVGSRGSRDAIMSSPIIVYDYPEIAPESPGNFFDSTEIDELLTLRTLTMTDAEKQEARSTDPQAAAILDRIEALGRAEIRRLHGTTRPVR